MLLPNRTGVMNVNLCVPVDETGCVNMTANRFGQKLMHHERFDTNRRGSGRGQGEAAHPMNETNFPHPNFKIQLPLCATVPSPPCRVVSLLEGRITLPDPLTHSHRALSCRTGCGCARSSTEYQSSGDYQIKKVMSWDSILGNSLSIHISA